MRYQPKFLKSKNQQQRRRDLLRFVDFEPRLADAHSNSMNLSRTCPQAFLPLNVKLRSSHLQVRGGNRPDNALLDETARKYLGNATRRIEPWKTAVPCASQSR
jgi:hypothetical protein